MILVYVGYLFYLVTFAVTILVTIDASKKAGALEAVLCFCFCPYTLYYMFKKFDHEKKNLLIGAYVASYIVGFGLQTVGTQMAVSDAMQQMQQAPAQ